MKREKSYSCQLLSSLKLNIEKLSFCHIFFMYMLTFDVKDVVEIYDKSNAISYRKLIV